MSNRTVFDNSGVAHAWARGASDARTSNGNFYSRGRKLYSYGSHFVAGVRMGVATFAINSTRYSPSTGRHLSEARHAAHGAIYYLPNLTAIGDKLAYLAEEGRKPDARDVAELRAYMVEHAGSLYAREAAWLASLAGIKGDAFGRAKAERARLDKAAALKAARIKRATAKAAALKLADMTPDAWRDHVRLIASGGHGYRNGDAQLAELATELRRARVVAKREGFSAKRLDAIRLKLRIMEAMDSARVSRIAYRQKELRGHVATVRQWTNATEEQRAAAGSRTFGNLAYAAGRVAELSALVRPAMLRLKADAEAARAAAGEREEAERAATWEREEAERMQAAADRRAAWLTRGGGRGGFRFSDDRGGALLRAVDVKRDDSGAIIGGTLETSHGADVPLVHAIKAFRFVKLLREKGESWARNGRTVRVGHYQIDSVDGEGFTAGCHRINAGEIDRLAALLGVADVAPCDAREPSAAAA